MLSQAEVVLRCRLGPYQSALYELVKSKLRGEEGSAGVKGINNTVMELRNICNHPLLRLVWQAWLSGFAPGLMVYCWQGCSRCIERFSSTLRRGVGASCRCPVLQRHTNGADA